MLTGKLQKRDLQEGLGIDGMTRLEYILIKYVSRWGIWLIQLESPFECAIEPLGVISQRISWLVS